LSWEWKSEGVMDDESGEFMETASMCRKIRVRDGETSTRLSERSRELIPDTR